MSKTKKKKSSNAKETVKIPVKAQYAIIVAVCLLLEILFSNYQAIRLKLGGFEEKQIEISAFEPAEKSAKAVYNNDILTVEKGKILFKDIDTKMKSISIVTSCEEKRYQDIDIAFTDDNFSFDDGFNYNKTTTSLYCADEVQNYVNISSFGEAKKLRLDFGTNGKKIGISSITINKPKAFHISIIRFALILCAALIIKTGFWKKELGEDNKKYFRAAMACVLVAVCVVNGVMVLGSDSDDKKLLKEYSPKNAEDQYEQLFYAITQDRLDLSIDYDTELLDELDNPYDRSERNEKKLHGDFWDRAYYKSKFYSYFGSAPIFTVYIPIHLITGQVPTAQLVSSVLALYAVLFLTVLYALVLKHFCPDTSAVLALCGYVALIFGSTIFPLAAENLFYYFAVLSGIGWTAAFLYFVLKAYYSKVTKNRIILLVLAGICVPMIVSSRPTLILYAFSGLIPAIYLLKDKDITKQNKIYYVTAAGVPIMIGAIIIMAYNYMRFESPFEFGFNYQLTVSIAKANTVTIDMLPACIYHYYFQQPDFTTNFPYISIRQKAFNCYPRYNYNGRVMGIFSYPITLGLFLLPFSDRKKDKFKHTFLITLTSIAVILSFVDMCKAGSHYRYCADILAFMILAALVFIFDVLNRIKELSGRSYRYGYVLTIALMLVTSLIGYYLIFSNEDRCLINNFAYAVQFLKSL